MWQVYRNLSQGETPVPAWHNYLIKNQKGKSPMQAMLGSMGGTLLITLGILAVIVVFFIMWAIGTFNSLVELRNRVKNAFSQIDVQRKRRYDLIPNLIEVAKKFMSHERETLEAVTQARNLAQTARQSADPTNAQSMESLMSAEAGLGGALENKVAFSRQAERDALVQYAIEADQQQLG